MGETAPVGPPPLAGTHPGLIPNSHPQMASQPSLPVLSGAAKAMISVEDRGAVILVSSAGSPGTSPPAGFGGSLTSHQASLLGIHRCAALSLRSPQ